MHCDTYTPNAYAVDIDIDEREADYLKSRVFPFVFNINLCVVDFNVKINIRSRQTFSPSQALVTLTDFGYPVWDLRVSFSQRF